MLGADSKRSSTPIAVGKGGKKTHRDESARSDAGYCPALPICVRETHTAFSNLDHLSVFDFHDHRKQDAAVNPFRSNRSFTMSSRVVLLNYYAIKSPADILRHKMHKYSKHYISASPFLHNFPLVGGLPTS